MSSANAVAATKLSAYGQTSQLDWFCARRGFHKPDRRSNPVGEGRQGKQGGGDKGEDAHLHKNLQDAGISGLPDETYAARKWG